MFPHHFLKTRYNTKVFQTLVHAFEALDRRGAWMISYADYSWAQDWKFDADALNSCCITGKQWQPDMDVEQSNSFVSVGDGYQDDKA